MTNNSVDINRYLQNEMNAGEKKSFEGRLLADPELQQEFQIQNKLIQAVINAGIKENFSKAIHKRMITRKITIVTLIVVIIMAVLFIYKNRQHNSVETVKVVSTTGSIPFINPPLAHINVPVTKYTVEAEKADTIFHHSGSVIIFPPFSFTDNQGNLIKGKVIINYREFNDPLDFFVSGIPMDYDSAGRKYNFESSGMCEIVGYQEDQLLLVNPLSKPVIYLSGKNKSELHNVYFLDTVNRKWDYRGKDTITEIKTLSITGKKRTPVLPQTEGNIFKEPVPPVKASDRPSFSIEIDPGSFEELFTYDKMKLEVMDEENYKRSDADEHWDNVKLDHTTKQGIYLISFKNAKRTVTYKVRPVLEGEDYEAALKIFNKKKKAYEEAKKVRLDNEKRFGDSITALNKLQQQKWEAAEKKNKEINALIQERNKRIREMLAADFIASERQRLITEQLQKEAGKFNSDLSRSTEIIRSFTINNFGTWNWDHPQYPAEEIPIAAHFESDLYKVLELRQVAVVYKSFNGITNFPSNQIRIIPGKENMLWSIADSTFYYFSYKDFQQANIQRGMNTFKFKMRASQKKISTYEEIKKLTETF